MWNAMPTLNIPSAYSTVHKGILSIDNTYMLLYY